MEHPPSTPDTSDMGNVPSTPDTSDMEDAPKVSLDEFASVIQALDIEFVRGGVVEKILEEYKPVEWERLFATVPDTLGAIGECLKMAYSSEVGQVTQKKDGSIPPDLQTNLEKCLVLGLGALEEAGTKMGGLRESITEITRKKGIMEEILATAGDMTTALNPEPGADIPVNSGGLANLVNNLNKRAQGCTRDSKSIVGKFTEWQLSVQKISSAYDQVYAEEMAEHDELEEEKKSLSALFRKKSDSFSKLRKTINESIKKLSKNNIEGPNPKNFANHLEGRHADKEKVTNLLASCLYNIKKMKGALELLRCFFDGLGQQINDLNENWLPEFTVAISEGNLTREKLTKILPSASEIKYRYTSVGARVSVCLEPSGRRIKGANFPNGLNSRSCASSEEIMGIIPLLLEFVKDSREGIHDFAEEISTREQQISDK